MIYANRNRFNRPLLSRFSVLIYFFCLNVYIKGIKGCKVLPCITDIALSQKRVKEEISKACDKIIPMHC